MVTDALLMPLVWLAEWLDRVLPDGEPLPLPSTDSLWSALAGLNALVPVGEVVFAALTLLGAVGTFLVVRAVLFVWNLVWP